MTRLEFLKSLWTRFFKPILIIGVLAFLVRFFIHALDAESEERELVNLIGLGFIIGGLLISIGFLLMYVSKLVAANTPDYIKRVLTRNSKRINIAFYAILATAILFFVIKFIVEKDYWNLIGLMMVMGVHFLQRLFADRK